MDKNKFKELLFKRATEKGFTDCEMYYSTNTGITVDIFRSTLDKFSSSTTGGVSFRGLYNNKMGFSYVESLDEFSIDLLVDYAKENALLLDNNDKEFIYNGDDKYQDVKTYFKEIEEVDTEKLFEIGLELEKSVLNYDAKIKNPKDIILSKSSSEIFIANTKGLCLEDKQNYLFYYVSVFAKNGENIKDGSSYKVSFNKDVDIHKIIKEACDDALDGLGATSVKSGKYNIIFKNNAFCDLFGCFTSNFYAEMVQKGLSILNGKLNTKIASSKITIFDNPLMENGYSSSSFDSEGVACYDKVVVLDGNLKTFLYNLKSSNKDGVKSTGNGFRNGYKGKISTSYTNFYIKNGNTPFDTMVKNMDDGIIITKLSGLHAGVNSISGDFSLLAEGFIAKNGTKDIPIEQITISGNFFEILSNIDDIADDIKFSPNGIGSPSIFANKLSISGE